MYYSRKRMATGIPASSDDVRTFLVLMLVLI